MCRRSSAFIVNLAIRTKTNSRWCVTESTIVSHHVQISEIEKPSRLPTQQRSGIIMTKYYIVNVYVDFKRYFQRFVFCLLRELTGEVVVHKYYR